MTRQCPQEARGTPLVPSPRLVVVGTQAELTRPDDEPRDRQDARRASLIRLWFLSCAVAVAGLIVLGGVTRLTRSGLSITEWNPVLGILPPLDHASWEEAFARYRNTPEYRIVNMGMTIDSFRRIYLFEYLHRLLARFVGLLIGVPLTIYAVRGQVRPRLALMIIGLVLVQGVMGWCMVRSGLIDVPHVSPYRLATHLLLGLSLFSLLLRYGLDDEVRPIATEGSMLSRARRSAIALIVVTVLTALWGAMMAGMRAGYVSNTFPTMNGAWIPAAVGATGWLPGDMLTNPISVHFFHRLLGALTAVVAVLTAYYARRSGARGRACAVLWLVLVAVLAQLTLGALTVLWSVPVVTASLHQTNALFLLGSACALTHRLTRPALIPCAPPPSLL